MTDNTMNTPIGPTFATSGDLPSTPAGADVGRDMLDEATVVSRAQDGDLPAFEALLQTYQDPLYRLAVRILQSRAAAQDVVTEALISVWRTLPGLKDPAEFRIWIYRTVTTRCLDRLRRARSGSRPGAGADAPAAPVAPGTGAPVEPIIAVGTGEVGAGLDRALADLPAEVRICWILTEVDRLGSTEIARVLNLSDRTVRARLAQARHFLAARSMPLATATVPDADTLSGWLPCGRAVDDVWESRRRPAGGHERGCAYCRDARAGLLLLDQAAQDLTARDGVDPALQVDPAVPESIMVVARTEPRPDRLLPLARPGTAAADSGVAISESAVCDQLRTVADSITGVHARRCAAVVITGPRAEQGELDRPVVLDLMITVAVSSRTRIPPALAELRRRIIDRLTSRTGLAVGAVDITVEDIYDA